MYWLLKSLQSNKPKSVILLLKLNNSPVASKHIIQKQVIELEMVQSLNRTDIQNRVSQIYRQEIVPLLDQMLSNKSTSSTLIIDRLEINIGRIAAGMLEQLLAKKISNALQESLNKIKTPAIPETKVIVKHAVDKQESHSNIELVIYFLQTGVFPWWAQETTYALLEKAFLSVLNQNSANFKTVFPALLQDDEVITRLVYTFSDVLLMQSAEQLTSISMATLMLQKEQLSTFFTSQLSVQQLRAFWWLSVYQTIAGTSLPSEKDFLEKTINLFIHLAALKSNRTDLLQFLQNDRTVAGILEKITSFTNSPLTTGKTEETLQKEKEEQTASSIINNIKVSSLRREHPEATKFSPDPLDPLASINKTDHQRTSGKLQFNDIDKIYILNAGLVLLWPFLHRFFQNMGLANDKTFTDENNTERACLLLQYLATGSTEDLFEAQLPLNKLLCGIPLLHPLNMQWTISEEEKAIAENFLLAVIQNGGTGWKNLSINGLRQAYLNREGIISGRDGNWLLQIKRETYDILVDRLPWTVQVVKLSWMERLMFVEWQDV
jgi:hypothetical protein